MGLLNWGVWSAADMALFVAIWHQKHIRVKLDNGLLTNENEETDTEFNQIILRLVGLIYLKGGRISFPMPRSCAG